MFGDFEGSILDDSQNFIEWLSSWLFIMKYVTFQDELVAFLFLSIGKEL